MDTLSKIRILSDAAKYDASCSSSGSSRKSVPGGLGNSEACGICHSWAADGRCISLLKILLSNACAYDCAYCVNRRSNDVARTGFEPEELVRLVTDFYRRNYIEGAFLSSGVVGCPDTTMERLIAVARTLRQRERFCGYLHLKAIPGASDALVIEAGRWADRVSVNIELPSSASLALVAPDKNPAAIFGPMRALARASGFEPRRIGQPQSKLPAIAAPAVPAVPGPVRDGAPSGEGLWMPDSARDISGREPSPIERPAQPPAVAGVGESVWKARKSRHRDTAAAILPAGQTTQMVVGASPESDATILTLAENLYLAYDVRRVYYSAYIPVSTDIRVPAIKGPPLLREHRLYQADWLFRFYGFTASEILDNGAANLDDRLDPKCSWALRHMERFPVELNTAPYTEILRVPGIGPKSASRILRARRSAPIRTEALQSLGVVVKRARWFVTCSGKLFDAPGGRRWVREDEGDLSRLLSDGADSLLRPRQGEFDWGLA